MGGANTWFASSSTARASKTCSTTAGLVRGSTPSRRRVTRSPSFTPRGRFIAASKPPQSSSGGRAPAAPGLWGGVPPRGGAEGSARGATRAEGLERRGAELGTERRGALANIAARATEAQAAKRWPRVDELGIGLRTAAGLPPGRPSDAPPWPVLGLEA